MSSRSSRSAAVPITAARKPKTAINIDAIGISLDLDRPADGARGDRVLVVVEPHQAGLRDRGLDRVEAIERSADRYQLGPLRLEGLPDRPVGQFAVLVRLGVSDAAIE